MCHFQPFWHSPEVLTLWVVDNECITKIFTLCTCSYTLFKTYKYTLVSAESISSKRRLDTLHWCLGHAEAVLLLHICIRDIDISSYAKKSFDCFAFT